MDVNQNIPAAWGEYVTQTNLGLEIRPGVLFDTLVYDSSTPPTELMFFQQGNVPLNISNVKNGRLDNPDAFLIQAMCVFFPGSVLDQEDFPETGETTSQVDDNIVLSSTGVASLKIQNKTYGPWPIWRLPASTFVKGMLAAAGGDTNGIVGYGQLDGPMYALFPNLMLSPLQPFSFTLSWPVGLLLPNGPPSVSVDTPIQCLFDGQLATSIQ